VMWLLALVFPLARTSGWWERREVRRHAGRSGILFSFRGPPSFQKGRNTVTDWMVLLVFIDGDQIRESPFDPARRPFWRPVRPGTYAVEFRGFPDVLLWSGEVVVGSGPVVVAVWPETTGMATAPSRVLVDGVEVP
jgi:hypothetical protein